MPMILKVGIAKKVGQPNFCSLGASCGLEFELDDALLTVDSAALHEKIGAAYAACHNAIDREITRQVRATCTPQADAETQSNGHAHRASVSQPQIAVANLRQDGEVPSPATVTRRKATANQIRALHTLAQKQGFNLTDRLRSTFQLYRAEDLSIGEASQLIDSLTSSTRVNFRRVDRLA